MPTKIIFDTDPGIDDSMALLLALRSPELDVLGVTTVFGNAGLRHNTLNALRVLEVAGRGDIPVAAGAAQALVRQYRGRGADVHGQDGLGDAGLPLPTGQPLAEHAAAFIIRAVLAQPKTITLVAVGPLTNLALAVRLEPRLAEAVKEVIIMGGAAYVPGNITPAAEANIYNDPEAAAIVFSAGWPLTMVGLDVTTRTVMTPAYLDSLAAGRNPLTDFISKIVPHYLKFYREVMKLDGAYTHDPSAVGFAIDRSLFRTRPVPVFIEREGNCAGQTVPDPYRQWTQSAEIEVCVEVDSDRLLRLFMERLRGR